MQLWLLRLGSDGQYEEDALNHKKISISYGIQQDVNGLNINDIKELISLYNSNERSVRNRASQIFDFSSSMKIGDIIISNLTKRKCYGIARIEGPCHPMQPTMRPSRSVTWLRDDLPATDVPANLRRSLASPRTVSRDRHGYIADVLELLNPISLDTPLLVDEFDRSVTEGRLRKEIRRHVWREREPSIIAEKKRRAKELRCEACGFLFNERYGSLGDNFIECHHLVPIGGREGERKTTLQDLALLCANCHRMIHRLIAREPQKRLSVEDFRATCMS